MRLPIVQLSCRLSLAKHHITQVFQPDLAPCDFWLFPGLKLPIKMEGIYECDGHTVYKLSQRRLTADWLAPRESDCWRKHSKVSSDWMPSYIKATWPVLEILKMAAYFPDSPHEVDDSSSNQCAGNYEISTPSRRRVAYEAPPCELSACMYRVFLLCSHRPEDHHKRAAALVQAVSWSDDAYHLLPHGLRAVCPAGVHGRIEEQVCAAPGKRQRLSHRVGRVSIDSTW